MKMDNESGVSLVEILAALVILGIVFISFMAIFPQMNLFNQRTESKLVTMNLAKQELAELKKAPSRLTLERKLKDSLPSERHETYDLSRDTYTIQIDCYDTETPTPITCSGTAGKPLLHKIHIRIEENGKLTSETFGYLELK